MQYYVLKLNYDFLQKSFKSMHIWYSLLEFLQFLNQFINMLLPNAAL